MIRLFVFAGWGAALATLFWDNSRYLDPAAGSARLRHCKTADNACLQTTQTYTPKTIHHSGGWYVALAIGAALNTAVSLHYYIRIVRAMFIDEPESAARETPAHRVQLGAPRASA
jgi:hypothetical protein